jgi:hypothetical protein
MENPWPPGQHHVYFQTFNVNVNYIDHGKYLNSSYCGFKEDFLKFYCIYLKETHDTTPYCTVNFEPRALILTILDEFQTKYQNSSEQNFF